MHRASGSVYVGVNNNNRVIVASDDAEKAMKTVVKLLEQTPGCRSDDTVAVYKVQKIIHDLNFKHLKLCKLLESLDRGIEKSSNI